MQLTPFETHFDPIPIIDVEQDALVVPKISEHYFNLQAVVVLAGVVAISAVVVVSNKHGPSVFERMLLLNNLYKLFMICIKFHLKHKLIPKPNMLHKKFLQ